MVNIVNLKTKVEKLEKDCEDVVASLATANFRFSESETHQLISDLDGENILGKIEQIG